MLSITATRGGTSSGEGLAPTGSVFSVAARGLIGGEVRRRTVRRKIGRAGSRVARHYQSPRSVPKPGPGVQQRLVAFRLRQTQTA